MITTETTACIVISHSTENIIITSGLTPSYHITRETSDGELREGGWEDSSVLLFSIISLALYVAIAYFRMQ